MLSLFSSVITASLLLRGPENKRKEGYMQTEVDKYDKIYWFMERINLT